MGVLTLARFEFAVTTSVHFMFVMLTLGLVTLVAVLQTLYTRNGNEQLGRMTRFWGLLYAINYAVGIGTGLVMEFQFGLNWSGLDRLLGDVFGAPLALETLLAFVAESTLLGMWIFGWNRLSRRTHLVLIWGVALTAYLSAFWVMVSNAFLQHPVGYAVGANGRAHLTSFAALFGNSTLWLAFFHVVSAGLLAGGLFMAGVSAWHLRRNAEDPFFLRSLKVGSFAGAGGAFLLVGFGGPQIGIVSSTQPGKAATSAAAMAKAQQAMVAKHGPGDYLPAQWVHISNYTMMAFWGVALLVTGAAGALFLYNVKLAKPGAQRVLRILVWSIPVPFVAALAGWLYREAGRQPWAVYGLLRTDDAVTPMPAGLLVLSTIGFCALVLALAVVDWLLLARYARRGPGTEFLDTTTPAQATEDIGDADDTDDVDDSVFAEATLS
jgi:cytochrome d ubiquinol oxidase subunit I